MYSDVLKQKLVVIDEAIEQALKCKDINVWMKLTLVRLKIVNALENGLYGH